MSFEFRLRFHLLPEDRIAAAENRLALPLADHLRLVAWKRDSAIHDSPRLFLVGGPYDTSEAATEDGGRARTALLLWALQRRLAVDLGDGRRRTGLTAAGKKWLAEQTGGPVREQFHGLDVYEREEGQVFVDISAQPGLQIGAERACASIAFWYAKHLPLTPKQELAAELYCSAHFDAPFRSRFLTLMTSLEALLDHDPRAPDVIELVSRLESAVCESSVSRTEKQSILSSLSWLRTESIGQAGRRIARTLLPTGEYAGVRAEKYFRQCYELRSTIVHSGRVPGDVDLLEVTNELHRFIGDLLHAVIGVPAV